MQRFETDFITRINENTRALHTFFVCRQWFSQRLDWIGLVLQLATLGSLFAAKYISSLNPGLSALALATMSSVTGALSARSQSSAEAEQTVVFYYI